MTPTEKAKELVDKFRDEFKWVESDYSIDLYRDTRQCALIAVDEMLNQLNVMDGGFSFEKEIEFWQRVKREIEKL